MHTASAGEQNAMQCAQNPVCWLLSYSRLQLKQVEIAARQAFICKGVTTIRELVYRYSPQDKESLSEERLPNKVIRFLLEREKIVAAAEIQRLQSMATRRIETFEAQSRNMEEVSHAVRPHM